MKKALSSILAIVLLSLSFVTVSAESQVTIYASDGRTAVVASSEVAAYSCVGWFAYPVTTMYAPDGRTVLIASNEVAAYSSVGWYPHPVTIAPTPSYSNGYIYSSTSTSNSPNSGGSAVYRTPSGKRYHFDPDCGGKNSYQTNLDSAKAAGLTPCQKCAW